MKTALGIVGALLLGGALGIGFLAATKPAKTLEAKPAPVVDGVLDTDAPAPSCCDDKEQTWICGKGHVVTLNEKDKLVCPICGSESLREFKR